jgi:rSAM/selenodomain-associated transferase 1
VRSWIVVFAKAPRAGAVKSRMSPPLSPEDAAALYGCLLDDVLELTARSAARLGLEPVLAVHPPSALVELAARAPADFGVLAQRGADLGQRMTFAVAQAAAAGALPVLLRGSDSPTLDEEMLAEALRALATTDVVLCPDRDGGYNLVGLRRPAGSLFRHPMSTATVLADTLAQARGAGLSTQVLPARFDLDTIEDLRWLEQASRGQAALACPRTLAFLREQRLWPSAARSAGER